MTCAERSRGSVVEREKEERVRDKLLFLNFELFWLSQTKYVKLTTEMPV